MNTEKRTIAVCAIAKNENLYIKEWVEHYKKIGVDTIFLYDNNDVDGEHFEDVINDDIQSGFVVIINYRGKHKHIEQAEAEKTGYHGTQQDAYEHCYNTYGKDYAWISFFDIDEFLFIDKPYNSDVKGFLNQDKFKGKDAIQLNWKTYGDNGLVFYDTRPVVKRFTKESKRQTEHVKTIVRTNRKNVSIPCHKVIIKNGKYVYPDGTTTTCGYKQSIRYAGAHLKHYFTKSSEEWAKRKFFSTSATGKDYFNISANRRINEFFLFNEKTALKEKVFKRLSNVQDSLGRDIYKVVVSLTSYKERLKFVPKVIKQVLKGNVIPYKVVVALDEKDVKFIKSESPELQSMIDKGQVELLISKENIKPHTKYFFAMKKYRDCVIITIDDDIDYSPDTLTTLYLSYLEYPNCVIANRVHRITKDKDGYILAYNLWEMECNSINGPSKDLLATGVGGVLYPPDILHINDEMLPQIRECLNADDVYLKFLESKNGINVVCARYKSKITCKILNGSQTKALSSTNTQKVKNILNNDDYLKKFQPYFYKKEMGKNKKVIYTCITGGYDKLLTYPYIQDDFDYVCFTDNPKLKSYMWDIRPLPKETENLDNVKKQRYVKINAHKVLPEYELSIWIDGNIDVKSNLDDYLNSVLKDDISLYIPKHPSRNCLYDEANACKRINKDKTEIIDKQINKYKKEGMPANYGLPQSGIIIRKHNNEDCIRLMETWWKELKENSKRDQLSFTYALWKNNDVKIIYLDSNIFNSKWFHLYKNHIRQGDRVTNAKETQQPNYRVAQPWY